MFFLADSKTLQQNPKTLEKILQNRKQKMKMKLDLNLDIHDPYCGWGCDGVNLDGCGPGSCGRLGMVVSIMWPISAEVINGGPHLIFLRPNTCHWVKLTIAEIVIPYFKPCANASSPTLGTKITHAMASKIGFSTVRLPAINLI